MNLYNWMISSGKTKKYPFLSLVSPMGGVVKNSSFIKSNELFVPKFHSIISGTGSLSSIYPHISSLGGNAGTGVELAGCGADEDLELALIRSIAETAERYATCVYNNEDVEVASFNEMLTDGILSTKIPRCSEDEYSNPKCILRPINPDLPLRWVTGYSITRKQNCWVPLIMSHLYARPWSSESFWIPISTGVAAHTNFAKAAVSAICEVIERDAIALIWLLRMNLPSLKIDEYIPLEYQEKINRLKSSCLEHHVFNATLDTGVPILYSVQLRNDSNHAAQFVNCSASFEPWDSYGKLIRESAVGRTVLEHNLKIPSDINDFIELEHGAIYMGRRENRKAFNFLLSQEEEFMTPSKNISELSSNMPIGENAQLNYLIKHFKSLDMDIVLVDLTTDDLRDAGLYVIRAIIPELMPMSCCHSSRYLGHERLIKMKKILDKNSGYERDINFYPQPFA
ncbi:YcaO-like family protein [Acinetobacter baumannii]|nr:YcaO-like family protein [Acinetobacter baumannii]MDC4934122.1 YcaO-like family protein [Acinetobacter baumannii]